MTSRKLDLRRVRMHLVYELPDIARVLGVHKNTIRNFMKQGLEPVGGGRPILFLGSDVRSFLEKKRKSRKQPTPIGMLYCFRCREPRLPTADTLIFEPSDTRAGNLTASCETCGSQMNRRIRESELSIRMPGLAIQT